MPRTTIDIDGPILRDLKRLQRRQRRSLGRLVSDLLAQALGASQRATQAKAPVLRWITRPMAARLDLTDKEAVRAALDRS